MWCPSCDARPVSGLRERAKRQRYCQPSVGDDFAGAGYSVTFALSTHAPASAFTALAMRSMPWGRGNLAIRPVAAVAMLSGRDVLSIF